MLGDPLDPFDQVYHPDGFYHPDGLTLTEREFIQKENAKLAYATIVAQRTKKKTYEALKAEGLPIPSDLKWEVEESARGPYIPDPPEPEVEAQPSVDFTWLKDAVIHLLKESISKGIQ